MRISLLSLFVLKFVLFFSQTPSIDPHWQLTKAWEFTTISNSEFLNDWNTQPCSRALDHGGGNVEPQYYLPNNVTVDNLGLHLKIKNQPVAGKIICYQPDNFMLSDNVNNLRTSYFPQAGRKLNHNGIRSMGL